LRAIGLTLGADVPVFVFGRNAFAEGVGEALQRVVLPAAWFVVLEPPVQVPTAAIFSAPELHRNSPSIGPSDCRPGWGGNDLEAVARARFPEVGAAIDWLAQFGRAQMSGSGACVFAEFKQREAALDVLSQVPSPLRGWVASGLTQHPLHGLAA
jgi:4-diphosphocytidyl-2-C-methyl-D-erythritol kinase